ncbi:MAG: DUF4139 domain-containing protein [Desulfohalobium sp.]
MFRGLVLCLFVCVFFGPSQLWAKPDKVVLFPQSAQVEDRREVPAATTTLSWEVPGHLAPDSVQVRLPGSTVLEAVHTERVEREPEEVAPELAAEVEALRQDKEKLRLRHQAAEAEVDLLQGRADAGAVEVEQSQSWRKGLEAALQRLSSVRTQMTNVRDSLQEKNATLQELVQKPLWEVQVRVSDAPSKSGEAELQYRLDKCGWKPMYRVQGLPGENTVRFAWRAQLQQHSGQDWEGVELAVATVAPRSRLAPPELSPWVIRPQPEMRPMAKNNRNAAMLMNEASADAAQPEHTAATGFSLWQLGPTDLAHGAKRVLTLEQRDLAAEFTRLARPERSEAVFVRARLEQPLQRDILRGSGQFFLDGVFLRRHKISAVGQELFFGTDPFVSAQMRSKRVQAGDEGLLAKRQTRQWQWGIELENKREQAVDVQVEVAAVQSEHEDINVEQTFSVPAEQNKKRYVLDVAVPAEGQANATMKVKAEAPEDMDVFWGR